MVRHWLSIFESSSNSCNIRASIFSLDDLGVVFCSSTFLLSGPEEQTFFTFVILSEMNLSAILESISFKGDGNRRRRVFPKSFSRSIGLCRVPTDRTGLDCVSGCLMGTLLLDFAFKLFINPAACSFCFNNCRSNNALFSSSDEGASWHPTASFSGNSESEGIWLASEAGVGREEP